MALLWHVRRHACSIKSLSSTFLAVLILVISRTTAVVNEQSSLETIVQLGTESALVDPVTTFGLADVLLLPSQCLVTSGDSIELYYDCLAITGFELYNQYVQPSFMTALSIAVIQNTNDEFAIGFTVRTNPSVQGPISIHFNSSDLIGNQFPILSDIDCSECFSWDSELGIGSISLNMFGIDEKKFAIGPLAAGFKIVFDPIVANSKLKVNLQSFDLEPDDLLSTTLGEFSGISIYQADLQATQPFKFIALQESIQWTVSSLCDLVCGKKVTFLESQEDESVLRTLLDSLLTCDSNVLLAAAALINTIAENEWQSFSSLDMEEYIQNYIDCAEITISNQQHEYVAYDMIAYFGAVASLIRQAPLSEDQRFSLAEQQLTVVSTIVGSDRTASVEELVSFGLAFAWADTMEMAAVCQFQNLYLLNESLVLSLRLSNLYIETIAVKHMKAEHLATIVSSLDTIFSSLETCPQTLEYNETQTLMLLSNFLESVFDICSPQNNTVCEQLPRMDILKNIVSPYLTSRGKCTSTSSSMMSLFNFTANIFRTFAIHHNYMFDLLDCQFSFQLVSTFSDAICFPKFDEESTTSSSPVSMVSLGVSIIDDVGTIFQETPAMFSNCISGLDTIPTLKVAKFCFLLAQNFTDYISCASNVIQHLRLPSSLKSVIENDWEEFVEGILAFMHDGAVTPAEAIEASELVEVIVDQYDPAGSEASGAILEEVLGLTLTHKVLKSTSVTFEMVQTADDMCTYTSMFEHSPNNHLSSSTKMQACPLKKASFTLPSLPDLGAQSLGYSNSSSNLRAVRVRMLSKDPRQVLETQHGSVLSYIVSIELASNSASVIPLDDPVKFEFELMPGNQSIENVHIKILDDAFDSGLIPFHANATGVVIKSLSYDFQESNQKIWAIAQATVNGTTEIVRIPVSASCVYFNEDSYSWNTTGCNTHIGSDVIECECYHLTSFAVLCRADSGQAHGKMSANDHEKVLSGITFAGLFISIIFLLATLATFVLLRKTKYFSHRQKITTQFVLALLCAQLVFIIGIDATEDHNSCSLVAILLHYFWLNVFFFTVCEAHHAYGCLVKVFGSNIDESLRMKLYGIIGWVLPFFIVFISYAIKPSAYGTTDACWIDSKSNNIWAFIVPLICVLTINAIVTSLAAQTVWNSQDRALGLRTFVALFLILGLTWIFGLLLTISPNNVVLAYLFCICNSIQGVYVFLVQAYIGPERRAIILQQLYKVLNIHSSGKTGKPDYSSSLPHSFRSKKDHRHSLRKNGEKQALSHSTAANDTQLTDSAQHSCNHEYLNVGHRAAMSHLPGEEVAVVNFDAIFDDTIGNMTGEIVRPRAPTLSLPQLPVLQSNHLTGSRRSLNLGRHSSNESVV